MAMLLPKPLQQVMAVIASTVLQTAIIPFNFPRLRVMNSLKKMYHMVTANLRIRMPTPVVKLTRSTFVTVQISATLMLVLKLFPRVPYRVESFLMTIAMVSKIKSVFLGRT